MVSSACVLDGRLRHVLYRAGGGHDDAPGETLEGALEFLHASGREAKVAINES